MHLATSICKPACQERCNISGAFLRAALPMRFAIDRLQTRKAGAPHQIDQIDQHLLSVNSADFSALLRTFHFLTFFLKSSSCYSPVHILPTWSAKVFRGHQLFNILNAIDLSLQSCALFADNFPKSRPATAETETLLRRPPWPHCIPKKHKVLRPELLLFSILLDDDVVDIMMWSTWWCECQPWPLS